MVKMRPRGTDRRPATHEGLAEMDLTQQGTCMRKILLAAALLAAAPLSAVAAEGLSYTYVEGGWTQLQLDRNGAPSKPKLDGGYIRGSFAISLAARPTEGTGPTTTAPQPSNSRCSSMAKRYSSSTMRMCRLRRQKSPIADP